MKPALDTDLYLPDVPKREAAAVRLQELLPAELAAAVWDEIIGPLYDARTLSMGWRRGDCIRCSITHPARWPETRGGLAGTPWPGHRMNCPKYVGALEHRNVSGHQGPFGWRVQCSCGQSWTQYDDDGNKRDCPDAALDWRGPRPETETT